MKVSGFDGAYVQCDFKSDTQNLMKILIKSCFICEIILKE